MSDATPYIERLKKGLARLNPPPPGCDAEALQPFRRSLERTLARLTAGGAPAPFRYQVTGGKPLIFQGVEALPLEPTRLIQILNAVDVELQTGEFLDVDGALAAWVMRPEINLTESNLRQADTSVRTLKSVHGRDRDHAAAQSAETSKIRLRGKLNQLVAAIQVAQADTAGTPGAAAAPAPVAPAIPAAWELPPADPKPSPPTARRVLTDGPPTPELLIQALKKIFAAVEGSGIPAALLGDLAAQAWGVERTALRIEVLIASVPADRDVVLTAARQEGFHSSAEGGPLRLRLSDPALGRTANVDLIEAMTPYQEQVLSRAQPATVLGVDVHVASCEDLILLRAASPLPPDRDRMVDLLRANAAKLDGAYLKREAQAADNLDRVKAAWQQAKLPQ